MAARIDQDSWLAEEVEAKLHRVGAGPMRQLVDEGLEDKSERVGTRRAQRPGRHAKLHQRLAIFDVGDEQRRKFVGVHGRGIGELAAPPEGHEMIAQGDKPAVIVETTLEEVEARRPVEIVLHVVLAVPHEFHRRADLLRDPGRFGHEVVAQASAEAAADAGHIDGDVALADAQGGGHKLRAGPRQLGRRPEHDLAVLIVRR